MGNDPAASTVEAQGVVGSKCDGPGVGVAGAGGVQYVLTMLREQRYMNLTVLCGRSLPVGRQDSRLSTGREIPGIRTLTPTQNKSINEPCVAGAAGLGGGM